ncbi:MAG: glutamine--fructose-6-phosphate transaminase (isomerizing) [Alphaproteobacteria bacterium]|jgi:glucosamine--fructose-6-phosphate aminotransferase (isomerizing)|nr:glutamine--fructose-6-phosphate transaminase (isomerizing) [Alphaproteobacteria bacterium]
MCGIVCYLGKAEASNIIMESLQSLEYRGYDSAGIVVYNNGINIAKKQGKLAALAEHLAQNPLSGTMGIGHTRWATHGEANEVNAHPHLSSRGKIAVVHNGIIENFQALKNELTAAGYTFASDTDTEVIANLIEHYYTNDLVVAVQKVHNKLLGAYAIAVMAQDKPHEIVALRKESPLIVGIAEDGFFACSDIVAMIKHTNNVYYLDNNEMAHLYFAADQKFYNFFLLQNDALLPVNKTMVKSYVQPLDNHKNGYEHFMLKEIYEQENVLKEILSSYLNHNKGFLLHNNAISADFLKSIDKIYVVACGTAYFAGLCFAAFLAEMGLDVEVISEVGSEFNNKKHLLGKNTLLVAFSQSGETADTLASVRTLKPQGVKVLSFVNVFESSLARESDFVFYTQAGIEASVASTKAFTSQVLLSMLFALHLLKVRNIIDGDKYLNFIAEMEKAPTLLRNSFKYLDKICKIAKEISNFKNMFFIGKGIDYILCLEASLKMKEISYIHSEALPAGELKHGYIALIEDNFPVISVISNKNLAKKCVSSLKETKARGSMNIVFAHESIKNDLDFCDYVIPLSDSYIEDSSALLAVFSAIVPLQLLAYYVAKEKGNSIDMPRNLAKSVTVE